MVGVVKIFDVKTQNIDALLMLWNNEFYCKCKRSLPFDKAAGKRFSPRAHRLILIELVYLSVTGWQIDVSLMIVGVHGK